MAATDAHLDDPQTLYRHWEDQQWSPFGIELGPDAEQWKGYGTWFLREAVRNDRALADTVRVTLRSLLPAVAEALAPPDTDGTDWDALGASSEEIREFAISGLSRRLEIVGFPLESL